jgi:hypothetical protein
VGFDGVAEFYVFIFFLSSTEDEELIRSDKAATVLTGVVQIGKRFGFLV